MKTYVICGKSEGEVVLDNLRTSLKIQVVRELQTTTVVVDGPEKSLKMFEKWMDGLQITYTAERV